MKQFMALLAVSFSVAACNQAGTTAVAAASTPDTNASQVAAKIGSRAFSNADLDTRIKADMDILQSRAAAAETQLKAQMEDIRNQVNEQEYNLRQKALTEVLFDMEAQAKGIPRNELVAQEVTAKAMVTPTKTSTINSSALGTKPIHLRSGKPTLCPSAPPASRVLP